MLTALVFLTSPAVINPWLRPEVTPMATVSPTATRVPTATPDPFAFVPTVTPLGRDALYSDISPTGDLPAPVTSIQQIATFQPVEIPVAPTPAGLPPDRLLIPRLELEVPVEPVGMVTSTVAPGVFEWAVPDHRAAGWLNTSAALAQAGNTVLDGHHNIQGEVFRNLWTLQPGDDITVSAGDLQRTYQVAEVLILPEGNQPLAVRLANARYIQPTTDERLTLITCWPYEDNTHRVVVIARPTGGRP